MLQQGQIGLLISSRKGQETGRVIRNAAKGRQAGQLRQVPAFVAQRRQSDRFAPAAAAASLSHRSTTLPKKQRASARRPARTVWRRILLSPSLFRDAAGSSFEGLVVLPQLLIHRGLQYVDVAVLKDRDVDLRFHSSFILSIEKAPAQTGAFLPYRIMRPARDRAFGWKSSLKIPGLSRPCGSGFFHSLRCRT